ncbi:MAG: hypothetical protein MZV49_09280 [Rhodopseudomonas palustris]|nr:hypothetical protein [Rhodopseudomonas palustris]
MSRSQAQTIRVYEFEYRTNIYGESLNELGQSQLAAFIEKNGNGTEFCRYPFTYTGLEANADGYIYFEMKSAEQRHRKQTQYFLKWRDRSGSLCRLDFSIDYFLGKITILQMGIRTEFSEAFSRIMWIPSLIWTETGFLIL